jgi:hypothetical protein
MTARDPQRWLDSPEGPLSYEQRGALQALSERGPDALARERMLTQLATLTAVGVTADSEQIGQGGARSSGALPRARWLAGGAAALGLVWLALWTGAHTGSVERERPRVPRPTVVEPVSAPEAAKTMPAPELPAISPPALRAPAKATKARVQTSEPARAVKSASDPVAELALLTPARKLLVTNPTRALQLSDEHAQRFPHGAFAEERAFLRIEALLRLGRRTDAEATALVFRRAYASSTYLERLDQLLAAPP